MPSTPPKAAPAAAPPTHDKSRPGRPTKVETRAWELYAQTASVAMTPAQRRDKFREAVSLAQEFEQLWRAQ